VGADAHLEPVTTGTKAEAVLHHAEAPLDSLQHPVVAEDVDRQRHLGAERGGEHVAPGEEAFLAVGGPVVNAPGKDARSDRRHKAPRRSRVAQDAVRRSAGPGLFDEPCGLQKIRELDELLLGPSGELRACPVVSCRVLPGADRTRLRPDRVA
jgi:hypothetical protein